MDMFGSLFSTPELELRATPMQRMIARPADNGCWAVELLGLVNKNVDCVYNLLTKPNNVDVFRNVKAETYRKVLEIKERSATGTVDTIEVEHESYWEMWGLKKVVRTRQIVKQDDSRHYMSFRMAPGSVLRECSGSWSMWQLGSLAQNTLSTEMMKSYAGFIDEVARSGISCHTSDWTVVCLQYQAAPSIPAPSAMVKGGVILAVESIWTDFKAAAERKERSAAQDDDSSKTVSPHSSSAKAMSRNNSQTCLVTAVAA